MASEGRRRRVPGGDPILDNVNFRNYIIRILDNDPTLGSLNGRLLRLKPDIPPDATSTQLDIVLDALKENWRVEVLYIQNFEKGFGDKQLAKLTELLKLRRIWALNVGENFAVSLSSWAEFTGALPSTLVSYIYVSEHRLIHTPLKNNMRTAIRYNRKILGPRDPILCAHVTNMWFNPPSSYRSTAGQLPAVDVDPSRAPPSTAVVRARRNRDLVRIQSRLEALSAAGLPPPSFPPPTSSKASPDPAPHPGTLLPTVANLKRFDFVDYFEVPARVRVVSPPHAPLHPAAATCIAYMHHTISAAAPPLPSALELQARAATATAAGAPFPPLQIAPLDLPAEYIDTVSGSPHSGASSAFRVDLSDLMETSVDGARGGLPKPLLPEGSQMRSTAGDEGTRRSKRSVKKRCWTEDGPATQRGSLAKKRDGSSKRSQRQLQRARRSAYASRTTRS